MKVALNKNFFLFLSILFISLLFFACLSIRLGKDISWDLANYHFYNPYAILHQRAALDYWPTSYLHQYLNPAIDYLTYFLITQFSTVSAVAILGALHGLNFLCMFYICLTFFTKQLPYKTITALAFTITGIYAPTVWPEMGGFTNDNLISVFVLASIFLLLTSFKPDASHQFKYWRFFFAAFMLGMATGLKLTAAIFVLGMFFTLFFLRQSKNIIFIFMLGTALGILISSGAWMYKMWIEHHNPVFPFWNTLFQSPDFAVSNWRDLRFIPVTLAETLFYPFYFSWDGRITDSYFRDFRFLIVYVLYVLYGLKWLFDKKNPPKPLDNYSLCLLLFFLFSYWIWQFSFSIARYIAALQILAPLIIYILLNQLISHVQLKFITLFAIFYVIILCNYPTPMIRAPWYTDNYFNVKLPASIQPEPAMVLMSYPAFVMDINPRPQRYLIPYLPNNWQYIGIPFWSGRYFFERSAHLKTTQLINHYPHKFYLLSSDINLPELKKIASLFGLNHSRHCAEIVSDRQKVSRQKTLLCEITR